MIREEIEEKATKRLLAQIVDTIIVMVIMIGIMFAVSKLLELIVSAIPIEIYIKFAKLISLITFIIPLVVTSFLGFGFTSYFLKLSRNESVNFKELFTKINMFFSYLLITFLTFVLLLIISIIMVLVVIYLKVPLPLSLLAIIPLTLGLSCSLSYFVKLDNPSLGVIGSIKKSMELMKGNKWKLFKLFMSIISVYFIIIILFILTYIQYFGFDTLSAEPTIISKIPGFTVTLTTVFWLIPHIMTSLSVFYNNLVDKNEDPLNRALNINIDSNENIKTSTFPETIESETHTQEDIKEMMEKQKELISNTQNQPDNIDNNVSIPTENNNIQQVPDTQTANNTNNL